MSTESREELLAFLRLHPPYKDMGAFALDALSSALKPVSIADGGHILTPDDMPPDLYIIETGKVQVRQVGDVTLIDPPLYALEVGQSFPLAATAARRPATRQRRRPRRLRPPGHRPPTPKGRLHPPDHPSPTPKERLRPPAHPPPTP